MLVKLLINICSFKQIFFDESLFTKTWKLFSFIISYRNGNLTLHLRILSRILKLQLGVYFLKVLDLALTKPCCKHSRFPCISKRGSCYSFWLFIKISSVIILSKYLRSAYLPCWHINRIFFVSQWIIRCCSRLILNIYIESASHLCCCHYSVSVLNIIYLHILLTFFDRFKKIFNFYLISSFLCFQSVRCSYQKKTPNLVLQERLRPHLWYPIFRLN